MYKDFGIIYESGNFYRKGNFWVERVKTGFNVYKSASPRDICVAKFKNKGQIGIDNAIAECQRQQAELNYRMNDQTGRIFNLDSDYEDLMFYLLTDQNISEQQLDDVYEADNDTMTITPLYLKITILRHIKDQAEKKFKKYFDIRQGSFNYQWNLNIAEWPLLTTNYKLLMRRNKNTIQQDIKENGIKKIIHRELANHECHLSCNYGSVVDILNDYGITREQIKNEWLEYFQMCIDNDYF